MHRPWFFDRLRLDPTNDIKAIKRAYAVALKAIDQASERESFESLRKAYEQALAWARSRADEDPDMAEPQAQAGDEAEKDTPVSGSPDIDRSDAGFPVSDRGADGFGGSASSPRP